MNRTMVVFNLIYLGSGRDRVSVIFATIFLSTRAKAREKPMNVDALEAA